MADTPSRQGASHSQYLNSIQPSQRSARGGTIKVVAGPFCAATTAIRPETRANPSTIAPPMFSWRFARQQMPIALQDHGRGQALTKNEL
jgi:hypothetical protein